MSRVNHAQPIVRKNKGQSDNLPIKYSILLGELIRSARQESKLSQIELAEKAYLSQAAISQIEKGKRSVTAEEIIYLSMGLNKPILYFFQSLVTNQIEQSQLTILEQELLLQARKLSTVDLTKLIAQVKAVVNLSE